MDIVNFRDFGGYQGVQGTVRKGVFYRGASLSNVSDKQLEYLRKELNIQTVIDLRSSLEIAHAPDKKMDFDYIHLDILKDMHQDSANPKDMIMAQHFQSPFESMKQMYHDIIESSYAQKMYAQMFDLLLEKEGAFYIHCSAGKDRTGLAVSFILKALGVSDEDVLKEYLKSNDAADKQIPKQALQDSQQIEAAKVFSQVDKAYLEEAWETLQKLSQDLETYFQEKLDLDEVKQNQLREKFLE